MSKIFTILAIFVYMDFMSANAEHLINNSLNISEIADANGNIYLFRYISEDYKKGKIGIVSKHTGLISYTVNPLIFLNGQSFGYERKNPHIIISKHKSTDKLYFVNQNHVGLRSNPLIPTTPLAEFNPLSYEVEVPVGNEKIIAIIPINDFISKLSFVGNIETQSDIAKILRALYPPPTCLNLLN